jgi:hypothetical protein
VLVLLMVEAAAPAGPRQQSTAINRPAGQDKERRRGRGWT